MKNIYFTLCFFAVALLIQPVIWSCTCDDFLRYYSFSDGRLEIYDAFDYDENGALVETQWKAVDSVILGDKVRVGFFFEYEIEDKFLTYYPAYINACYADCEPSRLIQLDSVTGFDVVSVTRLAGTDAGESVLADAGWDGARRDSLVKESNNPFYPRFISAWFEVDQKPADGLFQLKGTIFKNTGRFHDVLSTEAEWK